MNTINPTRIARAFAALLFFAAFVATPAAAGDDQKPGEVVLQQGRWNITPTAPGDDADTIEALEAIGYMQGYEDAPTASGVVRHDEAKAYAGYNFYTSGHATEAYLTDMDGKILHTWSKPWEEVFPKREPKPGQNGQFYWRRAHLFPNGDVLAIFEGMGMMRLDKDSNILWSFADRPHHDADILEDGNIAILTRRPARIEEFSENGVLEDFVTYIDGATGKEIRRVSVLRALIDSEFQDVVADTKRKGDVLHTNSIEVLDGRLAKHNPAFAKGNVLVSLFTNNTVAVLDPTAEKVVWAIRGSWRHQHHATVISDKTLLFFDNNFKRSHIFEWDVGTSKPVWRYSGNQEEPFHSATCGTVYRLPNGNTLITESDGGRAFEVTKDKKIVWEFYNPNRAGAENELIATLLDVVRLPADTPIPWAQGASK